MKSIEKLFSEDINLSELEIDSDVIENDKDEDICTETELEQNFSLPYYLSGENAISLSKNYILDITGDNNSNIGLALSDNSCSIHTISESSIVKLHDFTSHSKRISNVRFNPSKSHLFYSGSLDGTINIWDLRQPNQIAHTLKDVTNGSPKPITSFDISENGRILCCGTELIGGDAFLLFWDIRSTSLLGGYWESHTDDITKVRFHKTKELLASGSTDGLINIYDISQSSEDDALLYTLNTESSVAKIDWYSLEGTHDAISCITHTEDVELWKIEDADFYKKFTRDQISVAMFKKSIEDAYVANIHEDGNTGELFIVAGSNKGKGECLRTLQVTDTTLKPRSQLIGNKQIVRSSWFDAKNKTLVTGGESSILNVWRPGSKSITEDSDSKLLKNTSKLKNVKQKTKPY